MTMRFEPGLVPMIFPASEDLSDSYYDCRRGFIAPTVGLGYYRCSAVEDGSADYRISHMLSGYRLPGEFEEEQQARDVIIALAECGIDWWLPQKALQALPAWKGIREIYDDIVARVCPESDDTSASTAETPTER